MNYFTQIFSGLKELKGVTILILLVLVGLSLFLAYSSKNKKTNTKILVYGGLCIAMSFVLSYIKLYHWPQGGSITPGSMLPIFIFAFIFGPRAGLIAGIAYGFLQFIQGPYIMHWTQVLLDYPIAFGVMGLAGLNRRWLPASVIIGGFSRFMAHFISGFVFFGSFAPEGMNPIWYSFTVNFPLMGTETAICLAIALIPQFKAAIEKLKKNALS
ncbi:energy-coupled thiamine transporter ThiT [Lutispora saccharofermentans]|uniref:Energy-coupled thiamine transporter ThiT n=1 Tax=Lutispora saccharofermentans TaxID=3024236 RepID=A0ABT1NAW0_9FIRM|nr:energy-coupled thiamine transporter ThiT [Lutispora saccharofermentans]MCQ1528403.1 energy-coupled thiamine transporter ThiT [Lutispora saccharofermentans]